MLLPRTFVALIVVAIFSIFLNLSFAETLQLKGTYSNFEGHLSEKHLNELNKRKYEYFYDKNDMLVPEKVEKLINYISKRREILSHSLYMHYKSRFINNNGFSDEKASKMAKSRIKKKPREIHAFNQLIEKAEALLDAYHDGELDHVEKRDRVADILLLLAVCDTVHQDSIFYDDLKTFRNVIRLFYKFPVNDYKKLQASNLLYKDKFQTQKDLKRLRDEGIDISRLNPPNSAFWTNTNIEEYDPENSYEIFGEKIFPDEDEPFFIKRMGQGTIKIKAFYMGKSSKGKTKKKSITLRMGQEAHTSILASHLARLAGYHSIPSAFRRTVKLYLGDMTYDSFIARWKLTHSVKNGTTLTHVREYNKDENYVILNNVTLEAYPGYSKRYRKMGNYRSARNGFPNRREERGKVVFNALIALNDHSENNIRVDMYRKKKTVDNPNPEWKTFIFSNDIGYSFGSHLIFDNLSTVNDYPDEFAEKDKFLGFIGKGKVKLRWMQTSLHHNTYRTASYSDAKWMARRFARISPEQIDKICDLSGFPQPVAELYAEKIKLRINNLIDVFDLENQLLTTQGYKKLHEKYPKYISKRGHLKEVAENLDGATNRLLGSNYTAFQTITVKGIGLFHDLLSKITTLKPGLLKLDTSLSLGVVEVAPGFKIGGKRRVSLNKERDKEEDISGVPGKRLQKRYLIEDEFVISFPLGFTISEGFESKIDARLPATLYKTYKWTLFHSVEKWHEVAGRKYFKLLTPWSFYSIKKKLAFGDSLHVSDSMGFSVGDLGLKYDKINLKVEFTPLKYGFSKVKEFYLNKSSNDVVELLNFKKIQNSFGSGGGVTAFLEFALAGNKEFSKKDFTLYNFDVEQLDLDSATIQTAYENILFYDNYDLADEYAKTCNLRECTVDSSKAHSFLIYKKKKEKQDKRITLSLYKPSLIEELKPDLESKQNERTSHLGFVENFINLNSGTLDRVFSSTELKTKSRNFTRLWDDDTLFSGIELLLNYPTQIIGEGKARRIFSEGLAKADLTDFEELHLVIDLLRKDNHCTRKEYKRDFIDYYTFRSGFKAGEYFLENEMPKDVKYYSPSAANMHWHFRYKGLKRLITALKGAKSSSRSFLGKVSNGFRMLLPFVERKKNDELVCNKKCQKAIKEIEKPVLPLWNMAKKKKALKRRLDHIVALIRIVIGKNSENLRFIRAAIEDEKDPKALWITTMIDNILSYKIPLTISRHRGTLYAKEYGKHPGQTFMERFMFAINPHPRVYREGNQFVPARTNFKTTFDLTEMTFDEDLITP